jgi:eukaryotic-like serine/threonine-protein kinase
MKPSPSRSRTLSVQAPITNEEERTLFQRRVALMALVVFVLSGGFWIVQLISLIFVAPQHIVHVTASMGGKVHIATTLGAALVWQVVRRGKPSAKLLSVVDPFACMGLCTGWALMILGGVPLEERPDMITMLACSYTLVVRASLIPSTPARTALVGMGSMAPAIVTTWILYRGRPTTQALHPAEYAAIWALLGVGATTVISYVIYGLRLQVRQAMQLGQYTLEEKIGEGGMGSVYRASHAMLRRPTAIKLLEGSAGPAAERFEREVQMTARMTHPNTVAIYDYGRTPDGIFYYAMELLDGISLEDLVEQHGPQPAPRVVHFLLQACGALEEAHAAGLVHRDIKPANIMLCERGKVPDVVKVVDFGLVKEIESADPGVSTVNTILGTPHYMAPEAIVDPATVDGRADLYALGCTAYFLLTGERAFEGSNLVEVCSMHLHEKPPLASARAPETPAALEEVVLKCLAKKREDRPKDAAELARLLRAAGVPEWTREAATSWWKAKGTTAASGQQRKATASAYGKTVAVALDDRRAS